MNIVIQPTARNVDNVKNLMILAQLHNFHNILSTFNHSRYCAVLFVYFVEGEDKRSPWLFYFDPRLLFQVYSWIHNSQLVVFHFETDVLVCVVHHVCTNLHTFPVYVTEPFV